MAVIFVLSHGRKVTEKHVATRSRRNFGFSTSKSCMSAPQRRCANETSTRIGMESVSLPPKKQGRFGSRTLPETNIAPENGGFQ